MYMFPFWALWRALMQKALEFVSLIPNFCHGSGMIMVVQKTAYLLLGSMKFLFSRTQSRQTERCLKPDSLLFS